MGTRSARIKAVPAAGPNRRARAVAAGGVRPGGVTGLRYCARCGRMQRLPAVRDAVRVLDWRSGPHVRAVPVDARRRWSRGAQCSGWPGSRPAGPRGAMRTRMRITAGRACQQDRCPRKALTLSRPESAWRPRRRTWQRKAASRLPLAGQWQWKPRKRRSDVGRRRWAGSRNDCCCYCCIVGN